MTSLIMHGRSKYIVVTIRESIMNCYNSIRKGDSDMNCLVNIRVEDKRQIQKSMHIYTRSKHNAKLSMKPTHTCIQFEYVAKMKMVNKLQ